MWQFLSIKSWIEQAALTHFLFINDSRGGLCYKPSGFLRSPRHYCKFYYTCSFYFNKANKWWLWWWWKRSQRCWCCAHLPTLLRTSALERAEHGLLLEIKPGQATTTSCNTHKCCLKNLTISKLEPTTPRVTIFRFFTWDVLTEIEVCSPDESVLSSLKVVFTYRVVVRHRLRPTFPTTWCQ